EVADVVVTVERDGHVITEVRAGNAVRLDEGGATALPLSEDDALAMRIALGLAQARSATDAHAELVPPPAGRAPDVRPAPTTLELIRAAEDARRASRLDDARSLYARAGA